VSRPGTRRTELPVNDLGACIRRASLDSLPPPARGLPPDWCLQPGRKVASVRTGASRRTAAPAVFPGHPFRPPALPRRRRPARRSLPSLWFRSCRFSPAGSTPLSRRRRPHHPLRPHRSLRRRRIRLSRPAGPDGSRSGPVRGSWQTRARAGHLGPPAAPAVAPAGTSGPGRGTGRPAGVARRRPGVHHAHPRPGPRRARRLRVLLGAEFEVLGPPDLAEHIAALAGRLTRATARRADRPG
jgi:hypothetical protein